MIQACVTVRLLEDAFRVAWIVVTMQKRRNRARVARGALVAAWPEGDRSLDAKVEAECERRDVLDFFPKEQPVRNVAHEAKTIAEPVRDPGACD